MNRLHRATVLLTITLLLTVGMAFGQANNVILEQSGDGNTANLGQTFAGPGGPNRALVTRFGAVFCSEEP